MIRIDKEDALRLLAEAVAEKGADHTVDVCTYVTDEGAPNCIVGNVLARAGADLEHLFPNRNANGSSLQSEPVLRALEEHEIEITGAALYILRMAQDVQDGNFVDGREEDDYCKYRSWGRALELVKKLS